MTTFLEGLQKFSNLYQDLKKCDNPLAIVEGFDKLYELFIIHVNEGKDFKVKWNHTRGSFVTIPKNKGNTNRLATILEGVKPLAWNIHFETSYDPKGLEVPPMRYDNTVSNVWKEVSRRAGLETQINGPLRFPQMLATVITAGYLLYGKQILDSVPLRFLKYYVDQCDCDLFREYPTGGVYALMYDSLAATRCVTMLTAFYLDLEGTFPKPALYELTEWLLYWPFKRQIEIKGYLSSPKQSFFDLSQKGTKLLWDRLNPKEAYPKMPKYTVTQITKNDCIHYEANKESILKGLSDMDNAGLKELSKLYSNMLTAEVNETNLKLCGLLLTPQGMCGFMRNERTLAHKKQTETSIGFDPEKVTMGKYLHQLWYDLTKETANLPYMPWTEQVYLRTIPALLTSRSAGGEAVELSATFLNYVPGSIRSINGRSFAYKVRFTDKTMVFMTDPSA